jgi:two-component sensor histidine kinase
VVAQAIAPYENGAGGSAFRVEGANLRLGPAVALALSMALHELCTNTVKYGALSRPGGHVSILWQIRGEPGRTRLCLSWEERGGPAVSPPRRQGFGTRLIERILTRELNGQVQIDYAPTGLACTIEAPLQA